MCSLPKTYGHLKETLLSGRESLSMEEVHATLSSNELNEKFEVKASSAIDDFIVNGILSGSENRGGRKMIELRTHKDENKESHTRRFCLERQKEGQ